VLDKAIWIVVVLFLGQVCLFVAYFSGLLR